MIRLLGLGGRLRCGKDAYADHLVAAHGFVKIGMADAILEHVLIVNPWIRVRLHEGVRLRIWPGFRRARWLVARLGYVEAKTIDDFRQFMWRDGTDGGRNFFGEEIWVDVMRERIRARLGAGERVVVTGVRYANELDVVRDLDGIAMWVSRPEAELTEGGHVTENALDAGAFDETIDNSGSLAELYAQADQVARQPIH